MATIKSRLEEDGLTASFVGKRILTGMPTIYGGRCRFDILLHLRGEDVTGLRAGTFLSPLEDHSSVVG